jgi:hypothetical protein
MRKVPRHQLHSDFVRAVRASGHSLVTLAALADFAAFTQLSTILSRRSVPASALNVQRLHALAASVAYDGPVFKDAAR